ncbi:GIY-YIG nuclease family protein [Moorena sp. SIO4A5]|uniref:GIY-YIG nuclease family protein n=1 Tax=Moorena sp. SIO4A5 TaxID=2607838 RepID=UPI0025FC4E7D|nr:GIY-YIG nuclease family protein [Moorena sp. SIO4A5]
MRFRNHNGYQPRSIFTPLSLSQSLRSLKNDTKENNLGLPYVYLIAKINPSSGHFTGAFKIGKTKRSPEIRLKELQTGNDFPLTIEYVIETSRPSEVESKLHAILRSHASTAGGGTEWFYFSNDVELSRVKRLMYKHSDNYRVPEPEPRPPRPRPEEKPYVPSRRRSNPIDLTDPSSIFLMILADPVSALFMMLLSVAVITILSLGLVNLLMVDSYQQLPLERTPQRSLIR